MTTIIIILTIYEISSKDAFLYNTSEVVRAANRYEGTVRFQKYDSRKTNTRAENGAIRRRRGPRRIRPVALNFIIGELSSFIITAGNH